MRGLVVSVPMEISGTSLHIKLSALDPQELRSSLLFWDRLDFPSNNMIGFGLSPDAQYLFDEGILQRTEVRFSGSGDMAQIVRDCHVGAFRHLDQRQPGQWSIATGENSISFPGGEIEEGRGALVHLYNAIPVPDRDVPIADILEFKEKRNSELLALRHHLEEVYQRVINAGDGELAWNTEVERLEASINDHIKSSLESPLKFRLSDISASLNIVPAVIGGAAAYALNLPVLAGALHGLLSSGISVGVSGALRKREASATPFQYVTSYHEKLF